MQFNINYNNRIGERDRKLVEAFFNEYHLVGASNVDVTCIDVGVYEEMTSGIPRGKRAFIIEPDRINEVRKGQGGLKGVLLSDHVLMGSELWEKGRFSIPLTRIKHDGEIFVLPKRDVYNTFGII